jgi:alpha-mannosidase
MAQVANTGDGLIVRLYEAYNQRGRGSLTYATDITSAQECNLLEVAYNDADIKGIDFYFA